MQVAKSMSLWRGRGSFKLASAYVLSARALIDAECVGAVVVVPNGLGITADELRSSLESGLARFEVPERWWLCHEPLPTNEVGKGGQTTPVRPVERQRVALGATLDEQGSAPNLNR